MPCMMLIDQQAGVQSYHHYSVCSVRGLPQHSYTNITTTHLPGIQIGVCNGSSRLYMSRDPQILVVI
jgi:hypothetical protein